MLLTIILSGLCYAKADVFDEIIDLKIPNHSQVSRLLFAEILRQTHSQCERRYGKTFLSKFTDDINHNNDLIFRRMISEYFYHAFYGGFYNEWNGYFDYGALTPRGAFESDLNRVAFRKYFHGKYDLSIRNEMGYGLPVRSQEDVENADDYPVIIDVR